MMHTLVVKGNAQETADALFVRGIEAFEITPHAKFNECIVRSKSDTEWAKLAAWFCEQSARCDTVLGFPAGTLLWYGPYTVQTSA